MSGVNLDARTAISREEIEFVEKVVEDLGLPRLIREWNAGDGAMISSMSDLWEAISMYKDLQPKVDAAFDEAEKRGYARLDEGIRFRVEPTIVGTCMLAVIRNIEKEAEDNASKPNESGSTFENAERWIEHVLASTARAGTICGPDGSTIIEDEVEAFLFRKALERHIPAARRAGWLPGLAVVEFKRQKR